MLSSVGPHITTLRGSMAFFYLLVCNGCWSGKNVPAIILEFMEQSPMPDDVVVEESTRMRVLIGHAFCQVTAQKEQRKCDDAMPSSEGLTFIGAACFGAITTASVNL